MAASPLVMTRFSILSQVRRQARRVTVGQSGVDHAGVDVVARSAGMGPIRVPEVELGIQGPCLSPGHARPATRAPLLWRAMAAASWYITPALSLAVSTSPVATKRTFAALRAASANLPA